MPPGRSVYARYLLPPGRAGQASRPPRPDALLHGPTRSSTPTAPTSPYPPSTATIPSSPSPGPTSPPSRWASPRTKNHQRGERGERPARGRDPGRGRGSGRISVAGRPDGRRRGIGGAVDGEFDGLGSRNFSFFFFMNLV
jgi:hypothetical protein